MTYDPYQSYSTLGAYPGLATPFLSPYVSLNPLAPNPLASAYLPTAGIIPHPQLAQILAARATLPQFSAASPWITGLSNPLLASAVLQNPLLAASLENPLVNPFLAQTPYGAQPHPFQPYIGQSVPQFGLIASQLGQIGSMLAPQSWVGQPGLYGSQHPLSQIHPLVSPMMGRGFAGAGIFPTSVL